MRCAGRYRLALFAWPLLLAAGLIVLHRSLLHSRAIVVPEGDLVVLIERTLRALMPGQRPTHEARPPDPGLQRLAARLLDYELAMRRMPAIGLALLALGAMLWMLAR